MYAFSKDLLSETKASTSLSKLFSLTITTAEMMLGIIITRTTTVMTILVLLWVFSLAKSASLKCIYLTVR